MAEITFSRADVARLLGLPGLQAVETLIAERVLLPSAYTRGGRPLFGSESVRRAAVVMLGRQVEIDGR